MTEQRDGSRLPGWHSLPPTGHLSGWLAAGTAIGIAALAKVLLEHLFASMLPPYIFFYPAVVVAAFCGGPIVGLASAVVTLVLALIFFLPSFASASAAAAPAIASAVYAVSAGFVGLSVGYARVAFDSAHRDRSRLEYVSRESVHRIKNLIAVVQAIVRKVAREVETVEAYKNILISRLNGIGVAQGILVQSQWQSTPLGALIDAALAPFLPNPGLSFRPGPEAMVPANVVAGLSMALYELCTNSLKYGALQEGRGPVRLSWSICVDEVVLEWAEETPANPSASKGLGSSLIRVALAGLPGGKVEYKVHSEGVCATFRWPCRPAGRIASADGPAECDATERHEPVRHRPID